MSAPLLDPFAPYAPAIYPDLVRATWQWTTPPIRSERASYKCNIGIPSPAMVADDPGSWAYDAIMRPRLHLWGIPGPAPRNYSAPQVLCSLDPSRSEAGHGGDARYQLFLMGTHSVHGGRVIELETQYAAEDFANRNTFGFTWVGGSDRAGALAAVSAVQTQGAEIGIRGLFARMKDMSGKVTTVSKSAQLQVLVGGILSFPEATHPMRATIIIECAFIRKPMMTKKI